MGFGGADSITGAKGDDVLDGGSGSDFIKGGRGDDTIQANDGEADHVDGGPGTDQAEVDPFDTVISIEG
jgi:Ca2+-binding RTX toxin-like protein